MPHASELDDATELGTLTFPVRSSIVSVTVSTEAQTANSASRDEPVCNDGTTLDLDDSLVGMESIGQSDGAPMETASKIDTISKTNPDLSMKVKNAAHVSATQEMQPRYSERQVEAPSGDVVRPENLESSPQLFGGYDFDPALGYSRRCPRQRIEINCFESGRDNAYDSDDSTTVARVVTQVRTDDVRSVLKYWEPAMPRIEQFQACCRVIGDKNEVLRVFEDECFCDSDSEIDVPDRDLVLEQTRVKDVNDTDYLDDSLEPLDCKVPGSALRGLDLAPLDTSISSSDNVQLTLLSAEPHLADITPAGTQGHHPSTVVRSPIGSIPSSAAPTGSQLTIDHERIQTPFESTQSTRATTKEQDRGSADQSIGHAENDALQSRIDPFRVPGTLLIKSQGEVGQITSFKQTRDTANGHAATNSSGLLDHPVSGPDIPHPLPGPGLSDSHTSIAEYASLGHYVCSTKAKSADVPLTLARGTQHIMRIRLDHTSNGPEETQCQVSKPELDPNSSSQIGVPKELCHYKNRLDLGSLAPDSPTDVVTGCEAQTQATDLSLHALNESDADYEMSGALIQSGNAAASLMDSSRPASRIRKPERPRQASRGRSTARSQLPSGPASKVRKDTSKPRRGASRSASVKLGVQSPNTKFDKAAYRSCSRVDQRRRMSKTPPVPAMPLDIQAKTSNTPSNNVNCHDTYMQDDNLDHATYVDSPLKSSSTACIPKPLSTPESLVVLEMPQKNSSSLSSL